MRMEGEWYEGEDETVRKVRSGGRCVPWQFPELKDLLF